MSGAAGAPGTPEPPERIWRWLAVGAAAVFLALALHAARVETPTVDEFAHLPAGLAYLRHGRFDLYAKNPPLMKMLMAVPPALAGAEVPAVEAPPGGWAPWRYGYRFFSANPERYLDLFFLGRLPVVAVTLLTGLLLFVWSRHLFGVRAAAVAAALFYLSPTVLAHGHLATTDAGSMASIFLTAFALWRASRSPRWGRLVAAGAAWGAALLVKFTAVLLLPVVPALLILGHPRRWRRGLAQSGLCLAVALLVVNLGLGLRGTLRPVGGFSFSSRLARTAQGLAPAWLPVPLPESWVIGFDAQTRDVEAGEMGSYLLGRWSQEGWWSYHLIAFAVKTPPPLLVLMAVCPWSLRRRGLAREDLAALVLPLAGLGVPMLLSRLDIGVRYLLPLFPFLFVLTAGVWWPREGRWRRPAALGLVAYYLLSALWSHPHHLSYFSPLVGGARHGHRILADSNLDWGQDLYRLRPALEALGHRGKVWLLYFGHVPPQVYGVDYELLPGRPVEGVVAISVQYLVGGSYVATAPDGRAVVVPRHHAAWLRALEPVARLGSIWIFDTRRGTPPGSRGSNPSGAAEPPGHPPGAVLR